MAQAFAKQLHRIKPTHMYFSTSVHHPPGATLRWNSLLRTQYQLGRKIRSSNFSYFFFLAELGFELMASCLLSSLSYFFCLLRESRAVAHSGLEYNPSVLASQMLGLQVCSQLQVLLLGRKYPLEAAESHISKAQTTTLEEKAFPWLWQTPTPESSAWIQSFIPYLPFQSTPHIH
jgi:hypothetical protein